MAGFTSGADDYLSKPFSHKELMVRVEAVIRRTYPEKFSKTLDYKDISIDLKSHKVFRSKAEIKLSPKEFDLLKHFLINPKQVFSREQLLDQIWGLDSDLEIRTVDVHIRRLRKAINLEGFSTLIRTVRSTGYSLDWLLYFSFLKFKKKLFVKKLKSYSYNDAVVQKKVLNFLSKKK